MSGAGQAMRPKTRGIFEFRVSSISFNVANDGYLDYAHIESGLSALQIPPGYKYAKELFNVCDADGRIDYHDFRRYMDDKEAKRDAMKDGPFGDYGAEMVGKRM
ncbi:hypothetical protein V8G54_025180 [Vigna mungo]|uniref:EF-hand domain-containing protein n=1 Tax=Vigna mungo TaxID=3915 RepID=A0AAQ3RQT1_VIGMU